MKKYTRLTEKQIKKAIKGQKTLIRQSGGEPTWELFSHTFGWHQISKELTQQQKVLYKKLWDEIL